MRKRDKREAILWAALELIAEQGFQHTPMSLIASRANVSVGIIYHYFAGKDDVIQALYRRVKGELSAAICAANDPQLPLRARFPALWISAYRYCTTHPHETAFLEQYECSPALQDTVVFDEEMALFKLLDEYRIQGLLKDLPLMVFYEMTLGIAMKLALGFHNGTLMLDDAALTLIAEACWDAIAR